MVVPSVAERLKRCRRGDGIENQDFDFTHFLSTIIRLPLRISSMCGEIGLAFDLPASMHIGDCSWVTIMA